MYKRKKEDDPMEELTKTEQAILDQLPRGKPQALTARTIIGKMKPRINIRSFREYIASMRSKGILIGASRSSPQGYYLVTNKGEAKEFIGGYRAQVQKEQNLLDALELSARSWLQ